MNRMLNGLTLFLGFALVAGPASAATTRVYLMAGQSNMAGVGMVAELTAPYDSPQNVSYWSNDAWVALEGGFGFRSYMFGPEVSFGRAIKAARPDDDIYLVKFGDNGTNLANDWKPDGSGTSYTTFKSYVVAALEDLRAAGRSPIIGGMLWMQGESDAMDSDWAPAYQSNLTNLIGAVRSDFRTPEMDFILGRITTYYDTAQPGGNATVRSAQETVPGLVGHAAWIDTDDLQQAYGGHYGTAGQIELGKRFAAELTAVPEPTALVLWSSLGAMGLIAARRRKRTA